MGNAPPTFQNKLASLFHIHPGEGRQVLLLLAHAFFIGLARIFSRTAAFTLFLLEFDAIQDLPYVYVGISIIVALASFIYLKLGERLPLAKLLVANLSFLLVVLLGFWIGLELTTAGWLIFALPIGYELVYTFTNLEFWKLNGRLFNVRQGKRLFGLLSSGKTIAVIIGGFLVAPLVNIIGTVNLLLVAAAAIIVALGFLIHINRAFKERLMTPIRKTPAGDIKSTTTLLRNHYILLIVSFFALGVIVYFFIDNIFYTQAQVRFPDEDQLASFIGLFFAFTAFLTLFGQSFLTGRVIKQYGLRWVGLLLSPTALLITAAFMAIGGTIVGGVALVFSLATITKLINMVFRDTIDRPVVNILYQPLSAHQRIQVQTVVDGLVYPLAIGMAGIVLSLLITFLGLNVLQLAYVLVFVLVVWLGTAILVGRQYLSSLVEALSKRRLTGGSVVTDDKSSQLVLKQVLQSQNPAVVIYAVSVLQESEGENIAGYMPELLSHPVPEVRIDALDRVEHLRLHSVLKSVQHVIESDKSSTVKAHALRVLAALGDAEALENVYPYLDNPDPQFRLGAVIGALRNGDVAISMMAQGRLLQLAVSPSSSDRILACEALGIVKNNNLKQLLSQLLRDENFRVCRAALEAAGQAQYPDLWPEVITGTTNPETRSAAIAALVAGGEAVIPIMKEAIEQSDLQQGALRRLARVCGRIGGDQATILLFNHLAHPDKEVRTAVFIALSQCGFKANEIEKVTVQHQIEVELAQATLILASLADISGGTENGNNDETCGAIALLAESLNAEIKDFQSRLLLLLSFIYDEKSMLRAWDTLNLSYASTDEQAHAVEVVDVLVPSGLKTRILPLLDKLPLEQKLQTLGRYYPQSGLGRTGRLKEIIITQAQPYDRWLKANALYSGALLKITDKELMQHIATLSRNGTADSFLAETATWTLSQLGQPALAQDENHSGYDLSVNAAGGNLPIGTSGSESSLSTIEKIIILRNIDVFTRVPNETLIDLADMLEEVRSNAGQLIINKGDEGDCLYMIVEGTVRVHDGGFTINSLGKGDVFGEMALLDPSPRSASVTAIENAHLLRLDQRPFYQLMEDRIEIARGVIHVLSGRLRASVSNLDAMRRQLEESKHQSAEKS